MRKLGSVAHALPPISFRVGSAWVGWNDLVNGLYQWKWPEISNKTGLLMAQVADHQLSEPQCFAQEMKNTRKKGLEPH